MVDVNILIGPPSAPKEDTSILSLFFESSGEHIVCGGTTANMVAAFLGKELVATLDCVNGVPPIGYIEGVELVTEGVATLVRAEEYLCAYVNGTLIERYTAEDGAALLVKRLVGADRVHFFVGTAVNAAHQYQGSQISFDIKQTAIENIACCLQQMGKKIKFSRF